MRILLALLAALLLTPVAAAAEEICDTAVTDCREVLLWYINRETVRLDMGLEEMTDPLLVDAIIARFKAGVPVRLLVEPRRNGQVPSNAPMLDRLKAAGMPMRHKTTAGFLHWKMMIFAGQTTVQFSAANFTDWYLRPAEPLVDFTQDPLYFADDPALVRSFQRMFDDVWVDTAAFANYANATTPVRVYPAYPIDPRLNFVPFENFFTRSRPYYDAETQQIDVIMYKITERHHAEALLRAAARGVRVRLITEPDRYRNPANIWQSYYLDRLHMAGVQIRDRAHRGFLHQKTTLLYSQQRTVFGSSNWTTESNQTQYEHNYFSTGLWFFEWFRTNFERKWNTGETTPFVPLPPDAPIYVSPAQAASGQPATVTLSWTPGRWAHAADVYLGTTANPPLHVQGHPVSPGSTAKITISGLQPGTTYYWRVVSKTMANRTRPIEASLI